MTIHKAKTELSKLIARVEAGEEIEIARGANVVAKLVPAKPAAKKRNLGLGAWKGLIKPVPDSVFFDPLPEDEQNQWDRDPIEPPH